MLPHKQEAMASPDGLTDQLAEVFDHVQRNTGCHQRFIQVLTRLYERSNFSEFVDAFVRILRILFTSEFKAKCVYLDRSVDFASMFVIKLTEKKEGGDEGGAVETHPFLWHVIKRVLKLSNSADHRQRQGACNFVMRILQGISDDTHLDNDICDDIQNSMLERINDPRPTIRVNAVLALVRLQEPHTTDSCPVIDAFLTKFEDPHKQVRRVVVHKIAPTPASLPKIVERVRDVSEDVRSMAFRKLSVIMPMLIKIDERQGVVLAGFNEQNRNVKRVFLEVMLPKWLNGYEGNFLKFLSAISLDADEDDVATTETLSKWTMAQFFKAHPIQNIIDCLPINEDKLVPLDKLTAESVLYWSALQDYLGKNDELDEYLETVVPDLLPFCNYVESFIAKHMDQDVERWRHLMDNFILRKLIEMAGRFDLSDEVGRKKLYQLVTNTLMRKLDTGVVYNLIILLEKLTADFQHFLEDICDIISNIKEPVVVQEVTDEEMRQWNYQMAALKVQKNIFLEDVEDSIAKRELKVAAEKEEQVKEISKKMEALEANKPTGKKVRRLGDDKQRICQCLDIVNAVLKRPKVLKLTSELKAFKEEFMNDLLSVNDIEVYGKLLRFVANCAMLDKKFAEENLKMLCTPIITYRLQPVYQNDKQTLMTSIHALTDLLRLYNTSIFEGDAVNNTGMEQQNQRKLYRPLEDGSTEIFEPKSYALELLIDSVVLMLDDECQDIRDCAGECISHLLFHGIMISPTLLSRILVKIFNPLTEKQNPKSQQLFVASILEFALKVPESADTFEKAIIPTLNVIGNAPKTSPLADINIDRLIEFLTTYTSSITNNGIVDSHKNLAYSLCNQLVKNPESKCVPIWLKMLLSLNVPRDDETALKEIAAHVDAILEEITDKNPRVKLQKYQATLLDCLKNLEQNEETPPDAPAPEKEDNGQENADISKKRTINFDNENLENDSKGGSAEGSAKKQRIDASDAPGEPQKSTLTEKEKRNLSPNAAGDAPSEPNAIAPNKRIRVLDMQVIKSKKNQESDKVSQASSSLTVASGRSPRTIVNKRYWLKDGDKNKPDNDVAKKSANSEPSLSPVRSKRVKTSPRQSRRDIFISTKQTSLRRSNTQTSSDSRPSLSGSTRGLSTKSSSSDGVSRKSDRISRTISATSSADSAEVKSTKSKTSSVKGASKKGAVKRARVETSSESGSTRKSTRVSRDKRNSSVSGVRSLNKKDARERPVKRKNAGSDTGSSPVKKGSRLGKPVDTPLKAVKRREERKRPTKRKNVDSSPVKKGLRSSQVDSRSDKKELRRSQVQSRSDKKEIRRSQVHTTSDKKELRRSQGDNRSDKKKLLRSQAESTPNKKGLRNSQVGSRKKESSQSSTTTRSTSRNNTGASNSQTTSSTIKGFFKRKRGLRDSSKQSSSPDKLGKVRSKIADKNGTLSSTSDTEDSQSSQRRSSRRRLDFVGKQPKKPVATKTQNDGNSGKVLRKSSRSRNRGTDSDTETSPSKLPKAKAETAGKGKGKSTEDDSSAKNSQSSGRTTRRSNVRSSSAGSPKKVEAIRSPLVIIEKTPVVEKLSMKKVVPPKEQSSSTSGGSQSPVSSSSRRSLRKQDKSDESTQKTRSQQSHSRNKSGKFEKTSAPKKTSNTSTDSLIPQLRGSRTRSVAEKSKAHDTSTDSSVPRLRGTRSVAEKSRIPVKKVCGQKSGKESSQSSTDTTRRSRRSLKGKEEVTKSKADKEIKVTSNVKVKLLRNFGTSLKRTRASGSSSSESLTSGRRLRGKKQTQPVKKAKLNDSSSIFSSKSTRSSLRDRSFISSTD